MSVVGQFSESCQKNNILYLLLFYCLNLWVFVRWRRAAADRSARHVNTWNRKLCGGCAVGSARVYQSLSNERCVCFTRVSKTRVCLDLPDCKLPQSERKPHKKIPVKCTDWWSDHQWFSLSAKTSVTFPRLIVFRLYLLYYFYLWHFNVIKPVRRFVTQQSLIKQPDRAL